ncbi:MAG: cadherin repeat domain-containing protein, partial [Campylobacterales bacterium]|nr:cadherin repeat domain-containing protein [Campylobacterales bacterium]
TLDIFGNYSISDERNLTTSNSDVELLIDPSKIKKAVELHLNDPIVENNRLIFNNASKATLPEVGDVLIGDLENSYLRKILSITQNGDQVIFETEIIMLDEVFKELDLDQNMQYIDSNDIVVDSSSEGIEKIKRYRADNKIETIVRWASGELEFIKVEGNTTQSTRYIRSRNDTIQMGQVYTIKAPQNAITLYPKESISIEFIASMFEGMSDDYQFKSIRLKSTTHPQYANAYNLASQFIQKHSSENNISGDLCITQVDRKWLSSEPYTITVEVEAFNKQNNSSIIQQKSIKLYVSANMKRFLSSSAFTWKYEFKNFNLSVSPIINFMPYLPVELSIANKYLRVGLGADFLVDLTFLLEPKEKLGSEGANSETYLAMITSPFNPQLYYSKGESFKTEIELFSSSVRRVVMAGMIPVLTTFRFGLKKKSKYELYPGRFTANVRFGLDTFLGVEHPSGEWSELDNWQLTGTFKPIFGTSVVAQSYFRSILEFRLIPYVNVALYEGLNTRFTFEPYAKLDMTYKSGFTLGLGGGLVNDADGVTVGGFPTGYIAPLGVMKQLGWDKLDGSLGVEAKGAAYVGTSLDKALWAYPQVGKTHPIADLIKEKIFSIPEIKLEKSTEDICHASPLVIKANIKDGVSVLSFDKDGENKFSDKSAKWEIYPENTATIKARSAREAEVEFRARDIYTVVFVGGSDVLGDVFGRQFELLTIDTRNCKMPEIKFVSPDYVEVTPYILRVMQLEVGPKDPNGFQDIEYDKIKFSIRDGDSEKFRVDETTGVVSFRSSILEDLDYKKEYTFTAVATTPDNYITQKVTVKVNEEAFIHHNGYAYGIIISKVTGRAWLDRNIAASKKCSSPYDDPVNCMGGKFQWGRLQDGHEKEYAPIATELSPDKKQFLINYYMDEYDSFEDRYNQLKDYTFSDGARNTNYDYNALDEFLFGRFYSSSCRDENGEDVQRYHCYKTCKNSDGSSYCCGKVSYEDVRYDTITPKDNTTVIDSYCFTTGEGLVQGNDWTTADSSGNAREARWGEADGGTICPERFRLPTMKELELEGKIIKTDLEFDPNNPWGPTYLFSVTDPRQMWNNLALSYGKDYRLKSNN